MSKNRARTFFGMFLDAFFVLVLLSVPWLAIKLVQELTWNPGQVTHPDFSAIKLEAFYENQHKAFVDRIRLQELIIKNKMAFLPWGNL